MLRQNCGKSCGRTPCAIRFAYKRLTFCVTTFATILMSMWLDMSSREKMIGQCKRDRQFISLTKVERDWILMCKFCDSRLLDVLIQGFKIDKLVRLTYGNSCWWVIANFACCDHVKFDDYIFLNSFQ